MSDVDKTPADQTGQATGEPVRIRVDVKAHDNVESLVREYEAKYNGFRDAEPEKIKNVASGATSTPAPKAKRITITNTNATEEERMWAAIAHGSAILTLVLGVFTAGIVTLFTLFIPIGIYFAYRQKSEYVAYAALQAFALQVLGTVGWVAILVTGVLAGALLCVVLAITVVGLLLVPFVALAIVLFVVASFVLPLGMVVYGAIAAWETYQGKWYRYPYIGQWIDRQMHMGFLATI